MLIKANLRKSALAALGVTLLASCSDKEEQKLMKQQKEQEAEILALEERLSAIKAEVSAKKIDDPTPEIDGLKAKVENADAEIESLQGDIASLESEKKELSLEFDAYKRKYPIRTK